MSNHVKMIFMILRIKGTCKLFFHTQKGYPHTYTKLFYYIIHHVVCLVDCYQTKLLLVMTIISQDEYNQTNITSFEAIMQNNTFVHISI